MRPNTLTRIVYLLVSAPTQYGAAANRRLNCELTEAVLEGGDLDLIAFGHPFCAGLAFFFSATRVSNSTTGRLTGSDMTEISIRQVGYFRIFWLWFFAVITAIESLASNGLSVLCHGNTSSPAGRFT